MGDAFNLRMTEKLLHEDCVTTRHIRARVKAEDTSTDIEGLGVMFSDKTVRRASLSSDAIFEPACPTQHKVAVWAS